MSLDFLVPFLLAKTVACFIFVFWVFVLFCFLKYSIDERFRKVWNRAVCYIVSPQKLQNDYLCACDRHKQIRHKHPSKVVVTKIPRKSHGVQYFIKPAHTPTCTASILWHQIPLDGWVCNILHFRNMESDRKNLEYGTRELVALLTLALSPINYVSMNKPLTHPVSSSSIML